MAKAAAAEVREVSAVEAHIGTPGRRTSAYRAWLSRLLSEKNHQSAFKRAITKDTHPHFINATKHAAAYAEGLPTQPIQDVTPQAPAHIAATALLEAIPRLLGILPRSVEAKARLLAVLSTDGEEVE